MRRTTERWGGWMLALAASLQSLPAQGPAEQPADRTKFGGEYRSLEPRQQQLVGRWTAEAARIIKRTGDPEAFYNQLPLSARTTFEAVTHALSRTKLTSRSGKNLGSALDLIDLVERVAGQVPGARGDQQFRLYAYLKPGAVDRLYQCREFRRSHDNTVFHIGFPINFRQLGGVPSIQVSVTRTGRRADIDVDYRPSGGIRALTSGHLTSANSDVRAGDNHRRHVNRWIGLGEWWRGLLATFTNPIESGDLAVFTPERQKELDRAARGPLPEMVHAYLNEWLVHQRPAELLSMVSVKAYPCVAEFSDGSRPDSKLALVRMLAQLQEVNQRVGKVPDLAAALAPVDYALPESEPVTHAHERIFALRRIHEDTGWAMDCRIRYGLHLVESIPRQPHEFADTHVSSFRLKDPQRPSLLVLTWKKEAGVWRVVSFAIERTHSAPPPEVLAKIAQPALARPAAADLQSAVDSFLSTWLVARDFRQAADRFAPAARFCDGSGSEGNDPPPAPLEFLERTAAEGSREKTLARLIAAAEAGHHGLKPLSHTNSGAYLLADISPALLAQNGCQTGAKTPPQPGILLAFHFSHTRNPSAGVVALIWRRVNGEWRITSYSVAED